MIQKLNQKIKQTGAPIVVGLDPMLSYIPEQILTKAYQDCGRIWKGYRRPSGSSTRRLWMQLRIWCRL